MKTIISNLTDEQQKELDILLNKFKKENESIVLTFGDKKNLYHPTDKIWSVTCKTILDLQYILSVLPANEEKYLQTSSGKDQISESNFVICLNNPCEPSETFPFNFTIKYKHNDSDIFVTLPLNLISEFVKDELRHITDSEYHYFTGYSHTQLREIRVIRKVFIDSINTINWYGGNVTTLNKELIDAILKKLKIN